MDEKEKQLLEERKSDFKFVDDITKFRCVQCGNIAINHFLSDCYHVFCANCKDTLEYGYTCPICKSPITTISLPDSDFEQELLSLFAHCPNTQNGCKVTCSLEEMPTHLRRCKFIVMRNSTDESSSQLDVKQMFEQINMMATAFTSLSSTVSGISSAVQIIKDGQSGKLDARPSPSSENTRKAKDKQDSPLSDHQALQNQLEEMQNEVKMYKSLLEKQQYCKESPVKASESLKKENNAQSQKNKTQPSLAINHPNVMETLIKMLKTQLENQQPDRQTPGPSDINMTSIQVASISSENTTTEDFNLNESSIQESNDHSQKDVQITSLVQKHQKEMEEMQTQINMMKTQLEKQQPVNQSPGPSNINMVTSQMSSSSSAITTENLILNESSMKESNPHLQPNEMITNLVQKHQKEMEEMQAEINMLKNQQPAKQSPRPSNNNTVPFQMPSSSSMPSTIDDLNFNDQSFNGIPNKEYNILLLGQTGVGKSTFINALANYITYTSLDDATNAELISLIPCHFSISDDSFTQRIIKFGQDTNENMGNGAQSSTQSCRAYRFSVKDFVVRMIDSPGIGDTRGIEQDRLNLEDIFTFITQYDELHAICILLKPNESKLTTTFQFCVTQLLCQLHENASKNIVFVFTNSRNTFYRPGDTIAPLKTILGRIKGTSPYVEIPFHKKNTFCLDSEAFRFLVAAKNYINFSEGDSENFRISWKKSVEECYRMIRYVVEGPDGRGLAPHNIEDTTSINEARRVIIDLSKPLAENAKLLQDNIQVLNLKLKEIDECKGDVNKLKDILYVPTLTLKVQELDQPRTVCMGDNCRQTYKVGKLDKYHYPVICHDPCYLKDVPVEAIGPEQLRHCHAMNKQTAMCEQCGCIYSQHMHIYYESEVVEKQELDQNIQSQLDTKEGAIKAVKSTVKSLEEKVKEYENSHMLLTQFTAKLAVFLRQNALVSRNDAVEEYLKQEIENEKALNSTGANNVDLIQRLNKLLQQYNNEKEIFEKAVHGQSSKEKITTDEIMELITKLPGMNICGETITKMMQAQGKIKKKETDQRDVSVGPAWYSRVGKVLATPATAVYRAVARR